MSFFFFPLLWTTLGVENRGWEVQTVTNKNFLRDNGAMNVLGLGIRYGSADGDSWSGGS